MLGSNLAEGFFHPDGFIGIDPQGPDDLAPPPAELEHVEQNIHESGHRYSKFIVLQPTCHAQSDQYQDYGQVDRIPQRGAITDKTSQPDQTKSALDAALNKSDHDRSGNAEQDLGTFQFLVTDGSGGFDMTF